MAGIQLGRRSQIASGPPKGVVNSRDPFDDDPGTLQDARNGYIPAPDGGSGWYARPGFSLLNGGNLPRGAVFDALARDGYQIGAIRCGKPYLQRSEAWYRIGGGGHKVTYRLRDLAEWIEDRCGAEQ